MFKKLAFVGLTGGCLAAYSYSSRLAENKKMTPAEFHSPQMTQIKKILADYSEHPEKMTKEDITLYRYSACPFCGKVKTYLDMKGIGHTTVEVEPMFKSQIRQNGYTKVPQLKIGGVEGPVLVDSEEIVDFLSKVVEEEGSMKKSTQEWREWANEKLVRYIVVNSNKTLLQAYQGFSYIDNFPEIPTSNKIFLKVVGAPVMFAVSKFVTEKRLQKIDPNFDQPDTKTAMFNGIDDWVNKGVGEGPFEGGKSPSRADADVYGVLNALRGHPLFDEICEKTKAGTWMDEMKVVVEANAPNTFSTTPPSFAEDE